METIKNFIKFWVKKDYRWRIMATKGYYDNMDDEEYIRRQYYAKFAGTKTLNLENPTTLCEKLNWLKLYNRKSYYTDMVDKYKVKKYVADIIGEEYVIPALGVWDRFEDIDFDVLPNEFVLKCTHDSGSIVICRDKKHFDYVAAKKLLDAKLAQSHYKKNREWVYKNVIPRILAEPYIDSLSNTDSIEYKLTCFGGKVKFTTVCTGIAYDQSRRNDHFDINWERLPFYTIYKNSYIDFSKPSQMDELIRLSEKLSKDIPYLRVDWYIIDEKIYFGEMTFYTWAGYMKFEPDNWDEILGSWLILPPKTLEE